MSFGRLLSTSVFISLNSAEFCSKWIYWTNEPVEKTDPVLTLETFITIWGTILLLITIYIAAFVPETDTELLKLLDEEKAKKKKIKESKVAGEKSVTKSGEEEKSEEVEEIEADFSMTLGIFWDVLKNKNIQTMILFTFLTKTCFAIYFNVGTVYLTNDLGFPKENLAMIQFVTIPTNMMFSVVSGYLSKKRPFYIL